MPLANTSKSALRVLFVGDARAALINSLHGKLRATMHGGITFDALDTSNAYVDSDDVRPAWITTYTDKGASTRRRLRRRVELAAHPLKGLARYDVVHVHYLDPSLFTWWPILRALGRRLVVTLWGSDLLRCTRADLPLLQVMLASVDEVTVTSPAMLPVLSDRIGYRVLARSRVIRFGLDAVELMHIHALDRIKAKERIGLHSERFSVLIGHSASEGQQHVAVLAELSRTGVLHDSTIEFVVHLAYGDPSYRDHLVETIRAAGWPVHVDSRFRTNEELASFRSAFDLFINVLITDQFSGSMCEHLMAGTRVIAGSWLDYDLLEAHGAILHRVDSVSDVPAAVRSAQRSGRPEDHEVLANRNAAFQLTSWTANLARWTDFYSELHYKTSL